MNLAGAQDKKTTLCKSIVFLYGSNEQIGNSNLIGINFFKYV